MISKCVLYVKLYGWPKDLATTVFYVNLLLKLLMKLLTASQLYCFVASGTSFCATPIIIRLHITQISKPEIMRICVPLKFLFFYFILLFPALYFLSSIHPLPSSPQVYHRRPRTSIADQPPCPLHSGRVGLAM